MQGPAWRRAPRQAIGLALQLGFAVACVLGAIVAIALDGDRLAHDLRQNLLWLTPERAAVATFVVTVVLGSWSFGHSRMRGAGLARSKTLDPPVVALLALIVVAGSTFRFLLGRAATEPRLFPDELVYTGAAKAFALHWQPLVRGELDVGHSLLYPLLLSPAYRVAANGAVAFDVLKAMNAIAVVSAAIPAYLLARRVVPAAPALLVAGLVAFAPWTAYASLAMTESLFLLAFTTFVLLLARMLEQPSTSRQLAVGCALAVLVGIRPQALVLVAAVLAPIPFAHPGIPIRSTIRTYRTLLAGLAAAGAGGAIVALLALDLPEGWGGVVGSLADPVGLAKWSLWNLAPYILAVGVVSAVVFPLAVIDLVRSPSPRARSTGLALAACGLAVLLSVALISASPAGLDVLHERYLFYATPLLLVGLAQWLQSFPERGRSRAVGLGLTALAVTASLPGDVLARANNVEAPTSTWLEALHASTGGVPTRLLLAGLAALGVLVLACSRTRAGPLLAVAVAFTALVCGLDYSAPFSRDQDRELAWVDQALPENGRASLVHLGYSRPDQPCGPAADEEQDRLVVWTEFFNTRLDGFYHLQKEVELDKLPSQGLTVGDGGVVLDDGLPFAPRYAVLDSRQPVVGRRLARLDLAAMGTQYQAGASLTLWQVEPPLRFLVHAQPLPPRGDERECA